MAYRIEFGIPDVAAYWEDLCHRAELDGLSGAEEKLFRKLLKTFRLLGEDPMYPGLHSHKIDGMEGTMGESIFESYVENRTPAACRIFWVYGPVKKVITVVAIVPHPEPGSRAYSRIPLSSVKRTKVVEERNPKKRPRG